MLHVLWWIVLGSLNKMRNQGKEDSLLHIFNVSAKSGENLLNETSLQMYTVVTMATVFMQAEVNC